VFDPTFASFQADLYGHSLEAPEPRGHHSKETEMKQFLIVLSLLVASAAPATALEINQSTLNVFSR
jgi:hypothetical protein